MVIARPSAKRRLLTDERVSCLVLSCVPFHRQAIGACAHRMSRPCSASTMEAGESQDYHRRGFSLLSSKEAVHDVMDFSQGKGDCGVRWPSWNHLTAGIHPLELQTSRGIRLEEASSSGSRESKLRHSAMLLPDLFSPAKPQNSAKLRRMERAPKHQRTQTVADPQHMTTAEKRAIILKTLQAVREKKASSLQIQPQESRKTAQPGASPGTALRTPALCEAAKTLSGYKIPKIRKPVSGPGDSSGSPSSQSDDSTSFSSSKTSRIPAKTCPKTPVKSSVTPLDRIIEEMDRTYTPIKRQPSAREPLSSRVVTGRTLHHGERATRPANDVHFVPACTKPVPRSIPGTPSWSMLPSLNSTSPLEHIRVHQDLCKLCNRRPASDSSTDQICASCRITKDVTNEQKRLGVVLHHKQRKSPPRDLQEVSGKKEPKKLKAKKLRKRAESTETTSGESADGVQPAKNRLKMSKKRKHRKRQCVPSSSSSDIGGSEQAVSSKLRQDSMPIIDCGSQDKPHADPLSPPSESQDLSKFYSITAATSNSASVSLKLIEQSSEGGGRTEAKDQCEAEEKSSLASPQKKMRKEECSKSSAYGSETVDCPSDCDSEPEWVVIEDSPCTEDEATKAEDTGDETQSCKSLGETLALEDDEDLPCAERDVDDGSEETQSFKSPEETPVLEDFEDDPPRSGRNGMNADDASHDALSVKETASDLEAKETLSRSDKVGSLKGMPGDDSDVVLVEVRPPPVKQPLAVIDLDDVSSEGVSSGSEETPAYLGRNVPFSLSFESGMLSVTLGNEHCDIKKSLSLLRKAERHSTKRPPGNCLERPVIDEVSTSESLEAPRLLEREEQGSNIDRCFDSPFDDGKNGSVNDGVVIVVPPLTSPSAESAEVLDAAESSPKVCPSDKLLDHLYRSSSHSIRMKAADTLMHQYVNCIGKFFDAVDVCNAETKAELVEALVPHGYLSLRNILDKIKEIAEATRCEDTVQVSSLELRIYTLFESLKHEGSHHPCSPVGKPRLDGVGKDHHVNCPPQPANIGATQSCADQEQPAYEDDSMTSKQLEDLLQGVFSNELLKSLPLEQLLGGHPAVQMPTAPPVETGHDSYSALQHPVTGGANDAGSGTSPIQQCTSTGSQTGSPVPSAANLSSAPCMDSTGQSYIVVQKQSPPLPDISESSWRDCHRNVGSQTESPRELLLARNTAKIPKVAIRPRKPSVEQDQSVAMNGSCPNRKRVEGYGGHSWRASGTLWYPDSPSSSASVPVSPSARSQNVLSSTCDNLTQYTNSQCVNRGDTQRPSQLQGVSTGSAAAHFYQNRHLFPFGSYHCRRWSGGQMQVTQHGAFQSRGHGEGFGQLTRAGDNQSYTHRPWSGVYPWYPNGEQVAGSYGTHVLQPWQS